ncbi:heparan-alpha-glucosaminide N-acetyltransferase isoform X4 [Hydra vulgaris]|uniref:Heparan-alpha-glucosaminide N-acetyltransferase isoform X4 n=1 Tax=Hydra vulgaris TaxID=6087 RepID=A0ABM4BT51_HYDVU
MSLLLMFTALSIFGCVVKVSSFNVADIFKNSSVSRDEALFVVNGTDILLRGVSSNCYHCREKTYGVMYDGFISQVVDTTYPWNYFVIKKDSFKEYAVCSGSYHFGEQGIYQLDVIDDQQEKFYCNQIKVIKKPNFSSLPLIVLFAVLVSLIIVPKVGLFICRFIYLKITRHISTPRPGFMSLDGNESSESSAPHSTVDYINKPIKRNRVKSIDTFRGISIAVMIFVNYGGGGYYFFSHSSWNGLTVADLLFPWFIFIMGSSIYISMHSLQKKLSKRKMTVKIIYRSFKLLLLGLFLNNGFDLANWRLPGVLQRFAISYFVVALVFLWFDSPKEESETGFWKSMFRDVWFPFQHFVMLLLLTIYLLIIYLLNVPGCPKGYFGPGGDGDHGAYENCTGGASGYVDRTVFGLNHIYRNPTCKRLYNCITYDPEGLLGTIPSILLTYLGLQAARTLLFYKSKNGHIIRWFIWSLLLGALAIGLCGGTLNDGAIPINKNLWSLSYIFAMGSTAYLLLLVCYILVDVLKWWNGAPFYYAGMNSILLYCGHEIFENYFPFNFKNDDSHTQLTIRCSVGTGVWLIVSYVCYLQKIYLKL